MDIKKLNMVIAKNFSLDEEEKIGKMTEKFIENYYFYFVKYIELENKISVNSVEQIINNSSFSKMTKLYLEWFEKQGEKTFEYVLNHLYIKNLNDKVESFCKYYSFMLQEALEQKNEELILDYLYRTPEVMKEEYEKFGFLAQVGSVTGNYIEKLRNTFVIKNIKGPEKQVPSLV